MIIAPNPLVELVNAIDDGVKTLKKAVIKSIRKNKRLESVSQTIHSNADSFFVRAMDATPYTRNVKNFLNAVYPLYGYRICIIGMEDAGKSTLYNYIKTKGGNQCEETEEEYHVCLSYTDSRDKLFKISKGKYIGNSFIQPWHKDLIKTNDSIVFLVDINRYCQEKSYRRTMHSFVEYINRKIPKDSLENTRNIITLFTHADKLENVKDGINFFMDEISSKEYKDLVQKNYLPLNLRNANDMNKLLDKILV